MQQGSIHFDSRAECASQNLKRPTVWPGLCLRDENNHARYSPRDEVVCPDSTGAQLSNSEQSSGCSDRFLGDDDMPWCSLLQEIRARQLDDTDQELFPSISPGGWKQYDLELQAQ